MITSDIHIHTNLSLCAQEDATLERYIEKAKEANLKVIGISNHLWDGAVPGASNWYAPQNVEHVLQLKKLLPEDRWDKSALRMRNGIYPRGKALPCRRKF